MPRARVSVLCFQFVHPAGVCFPVLDPPLGPVCLYLLSGHRQLLPCSRRVANCLRKISVHGCSGVCRDVIATQTALGSANLESVDVQLKTHSPPAARLQLHWATVPTYCVPRLCSWLCLKDPWLRRGGKGPALCRASQHGGLGGLLSPVESHAGCTRVMLWKLKPALDPDWLLWSQLTPKARWISGHAGLPHGQGAAELQCPPPPSHGVNGS